MKINLAEIPEEGKSFLVNNKTAELKAILKDLIGDMPHKAEFFIKPLNARDFELSGEIETELPSECSRCALDFNLRLKTPFRGIIIPRQEDDRTGHYTKPNHVSETLTDGPATVEHDALVFDMGEYLHEAVAIATPFNPVGPENEKGDCSVCGIHVRGRSFGYEEVMPIEKPESPFAALKNIKLN